MPSNETTDATWAKDVLEADGPVLVDFWAPWCSPCKALSPIVDELADQYGDRLRVFKVNVDENFDIADSERIASLPTLRVYRGGDAALTLVGARPRQVLEQELAPFLG